MKVSIVGGSGYVGGEVLRLLLCHPKVEVQQVTSEKNAGDFIKIIHPNLRGITTLKFCSIKELKKCDLLFMCLPHGTSMKNIENLKKLAARVIDFSADFRLKSAKEYERWYKHPHTAEKLMKDFVYGIPELHRAEIKKAKYIAKAGCNATCTILGLYPFIKAGVIDMNMPIVAEAKCASSEGGNKPSIGSHHPERTNCLRSYKPAMHRHCAEMIQELNLKHIDFSATSVQLVRGILVTTHVFLKKKATDKDIWKILREAYGKEPFIRLVKEKQGIYRYPEPKILAGTNYCDIGFELDPESNRLIILSAVDNLMKGAAGQAVQAMNIMMGWEETTGLEFPGLHPV